MFCITCNRCGQEVKEPGGLLFGPPQKIHDKEFLTLTHTMSEKDHLCVPCYGIVKQEIRDHFSIEFARVRKIIEKIIEESQPRENVKSLWGFDSCEFDGDNVRLIKDGKVVFVRLIKDGKVVFETKDFKK
jgi:hypothetical protein